MYRQQRCRSPKYFTGFTPKYQRGVHLSRIRFFDKGSSFADIGDEDGWHSVYPNGCFLTQYHYRYCTPDGD